MSWYEWAQSWIYNLRGRLFTDEARISKIEKELKNMADILDTLKADFEDYKAKVDARLTELGDKLKNQLDPAKAQVIDDEINAAKAELNPPAA